MGIAGRTERGSDLTKDADAGDCDGFPLTRASLSFESQLTLEMTNPMEDFLGAGGLVI